MRNALLLFGLLSGCGGAPSSIDRDQFPVEAAQLFCDRLSECARGEYERQFYDAADCVETYRRVFFLADEGFDDIGCDYDPEGAATAWENLHDMSCEDFYEAEYEDDYDKVWDC